MRKREQNFKHNLKILLGCIGVALLIFSFPVIKKGIVYICFEYHLKTQIPHYQDYEIISFDYEICEEKPSLSCYMMELRKKGSQDYDFSIFNHGFQIMDSYEYRVQKKVNVLERLDQEYQNDLINVCSSFLKKIMLKFF